MSVNQIKGKFVKLSNDEMLKASNAAGTGEVNILKVNDANQIQVAALPVFDDGEDISPLSTQKQLDAEISAVEEQLLSRGGAIKLEAMEPSEPLVLTAASPRAIFLDGAEGNSFLITMPDIATLQPGDFFTIMSMSGSPSAIQDSDEQPIVTIQVGQTLAIRKLESDEWEGTVYLQAVMEDGAYDLKGFKMIGAPAPEADDELANKEYVDTKVSKSGDRMTGDLEIVPEQEEYEGGNFIGSWGLYVDRKNQFGGFDYAEIYPDMILSRIYGENNSLLTYFDFRNSGLVFSKKNINTPNTPGYRSGEFRVDNLEMAAGFYRVNGEGSALLVDMDGVYSKQYAVIGGVPVEVPAVISANSQLTTKKYVDDKIIEDGGTASVVMNGTTQLFTAKKILINSGSTATSITLNRALADLPIGYKFEVHHFTGGTLTFTGSQSAGLSLTMPPGHIGDFILTSKSPETWSTSFSMLRTSSGYNAATRKIINLLAPENDNDAATKKYVDDADALKVAKAGDTMTGFLSLHADPTQPSHAATKSYVDAVAEGLHVHKPARLLADFDLNGTYNNGSSGVGAYLDFSSSPISGIDGVSSFSVGDRIIVAKQNGNALDPENGVYVIKESADIDGNGDIIKLTRAEDFDTPAEMAGGDFIFVQEGSQYADSGWVMTETVITVGTTPVQFLQFSGAGAYSAGDALSLTGTEFDVLVDDSSIEVNNSNKLTIKDLGVSTAKIADDAVDKSKINADVAGDGLGQAMDGALEVKTGDGIQISSDAVAVKASDLAGHGLEESGNDLKIKPEFSTVADISVSASGLSIANRFNKEHYVVAGPLSSGAYFDLAFEIEPGSMTAFVDRLAIHEGASFDYEIQTVGGVSRVVFLNALVTSGQQQLTVGDTVFFSYQKKAK